MHFTVETLVQLYAPKVTPKTTNMNIQMYDAQADTIKVDDIASDDNNRDVLDRIKQNEEGDHYTLAIQNQHFDEGEDDLIYVPESAKDMGWLGYFVGKSDCVEELYINDFDLSNDLDVVEPFIRGLNRNKSIYKLNFCHMDLLGGKIFTMLGPFFKNNDNLKVLSIEECNWGDEGSRLLALALGSCKISSLIKLFLVNNDIEGVDIVTALSMHPNLQHIDFEGNRLGRNGCIAMAILLEHSVTQLEVLDLGSNELDDEGIDALVPALKNCSHLNILRLFNNPSITSKGWQHLASILKAPISLLELNLTNNNIDDKAAAEIASSLRNNSSLINLSLTSNYTITEKGWESFSTLLCDSPSVNSTFLSNHILKTVSGGMITGEDTNMNADQINRLGQLLDLNRTNDNKEEVAMVKILTHHNDFDMMPFFEWEFKVLPLMVNWFERASAKPISGPNIGPRKLSSIYQFVRGMPLLYVETRLKKELEDIEDEESQMEEKFRQRKQFLRDRKHRRKTWASARWSIR